MPVDVQACVHSEDFQRIAKAADAVNFNAFITETGRINVYPKSSYWKEDGVLQISISTVPQLIDNQRVIYECNVAVRFPALHESSKTDGIFVSQLQKMAAIGELVQAITHASFPYEG